MSDHARPTRPNRVFDYDYKTAGRGPARWSLFVIAPFLLLLGGWASLAPINSAAIAPGEVVLNQDRKTIQHLEGGLVDDILIAEGDVVGKGDPLLVIRDVAQRTRMNTLYEQLAASRALAARLKAERDERADIMFDALESDIHLPEETFAALRRQQAKLFESRRRAIEAKAELIELRKSSTEDEIGGLIHELDAVKRQLGLNAQQHDAIDDLYKNKFITSERMIALEREKAELGGKAGSLGANIARLKQQVVAADIEIIDLETETRNDVMEELQETELSIQELTHQMQELTDQLERTVIRAPETGIVMDLQVHTRGAVVQPGERILDIVPNDDRLIIEVRVDPNDIDLVTAGTKAKIQLSAYKAKTVPKLDGEVLFVSADILTDDTDGERYFLVRVAVDEATLDKLGAEVALYPGMPAQAFLIAGERTVADYLMSPIVDATYRALREE